MGTVIVVLLATGASASASGTSCEVQPENSFELGPNAIRVQDDADGAGGAIESALGSQFGGIWWSEGAEVLTVGLTAGPTSLQDAEMAVRRALEQTVIPRADLLLVEAHSHVLPVPYSPLQLDSDKPRLRQALAAALPQGAFDTGITVGDFAGQNSPGFWPQIRVVLYAMATTAQCEAALAVTAPYGAEVSVMRTDRSGIIVGGPARESVQWSLAITDVRDRRARLRVHLTLLAAVSGLVEVALRIAHHSRIHPSWTGNAQAGAQRSITIEVPLPAGVRPPAPLELRARLEHRGATVASARAIERLRP